MAGYLGRERRKPCGRKCKAGSDLCLASGHLTAHSPGCPEMQRVAGDLGSGRQDWDRVEVAGRGNERTWLQAGDLGFLVPIS